MTGTLQPRSKTSLGGYPTRRELRRRVARFVQRAAFSSWRLTKIYFLGAFEAFNRGLIDLEGGQSTEGKGTTIEGHSTINRRLIHRSIEACP